MNEYVYVKGHKPEQREVWCKRMGPIPSDCVIHHVDEDKSNNDIYNLVMMTRSEHTRWHGKNRSKEARTKISNTLSKSIICVETGKEYKSAAIVRELLGIPHAGLCCRGLRKTSGGYHWKYKEACL